MSLLSSFVRNKEAKGDKENVVFFIVTSVSIGSWEVKLGVMKADRPTLTDQPTITSLSYCYYLFVFVIMLLFLFIFVLCLYFLMLLFSLDLTLNNCVSVV